MRFDDCASSEERIWRGMQAYWRAEQVGLDRHSAHTAAISAAN